MFWVLINWILVVILEVFFLLDRIFDSMEFRFMIGQLFGRFVIVIIQLFLVSFKMIFLFSMWRVLLRGLMVRVVG